MLGIFGRIKDRGTFPQAGSAPVKPAVLERLEPRILLSGDGLLSIAPPDPFQDTPQVVEYAELLEAEEQLSTTGTEIHVELDSSDQPEKDLCQPILALSADADRDATPMRAAAMKANHFALIVIMLYSLRLVAESC